MLVNEDGTHLTSEDMRIIRVEVRTKLDRMVELKRQIDELQAEYDMLKKQSITRYFQSNDTFMTDKGLVLATYKSHLQTKFKSKEFKEENPAMYEQYLDIGEVRRFVLKVA